MAEVSLVRNKLEDFKCCANDAIHFKLVRQEADLEDEKTTFKPDMTHQIFGEQESIFGYKDLEVQLFYTAGKLMPYLSLQYTDRVPVTGSDGVYADNVAQKLMKEMPPEVLTNKDDFLATVDKDVNFTPYGELLHSYTVTVDGEDREFQIYKPDIETPGFREYHKRLQTFILFFIDAASYIDDDDDKWTYYLLFEKYKRDGNTVYAIAGYMTAYNYYAYPKNIRPRLSQFLILPPFQRQGHGAVLLQAFYNDVVPRSLVIDITVEDPSEDFQRLRDFVDARNCMSLTNYQPDYLLEGFHPAMAEEARTKLKLNKRQARRVYEILRLKITDENNTSMYRQYRLDLKRRLNKPFQRNQRDYHKLERALQPDELAQMMSNMSAEQRHMVLEKQFQEHITLYKQILSRLDKAA
ncbi:histone acetyltransferase type B catalytic subunit-like [Babylonia areolata]|uniref:histone acetyltransferase type B catalytic subunit-like n=1 Tax=Babylonia areolata TaxID=304850 RepID=UPI003FD658E1